MEKKYKTSLNFGPSFLCFSLSLSLFLLMALVSLDLHDVVSFNCNQAAGRRDNEKLGNETRRSRIRDMWLIKRSKLRKRVFPFAKSRRKSASLIKSIWIILRVLSKFFKLFHGTEFSLISGSKIVLSFSFARLCLEQQHGTTRTRPA